MSKIAIEIAGQFAVEVGKELTLLFDRHIGSDVCMRAERRVGFGHACLGAAAAAWCSMFADLKAEDMPELVTVMFEAMKSKGEELKAARASGQK